MCPLHLELQRGDIISVQSDVCVSSIHRSKDMTVGPLAKHILHYGGKSIQDQLFKIRQGKELEIGQVEEVSPGQLKNCKELMFICLLSYIPGNEMFLQQSIQECLELAAVKNYKSIAFPALGVGQGYPSEKVAACLIEAVDMHNLQFPHSSLDLVYIVLLDQDIDLIKTFLLMCAKGTTDLRTDKTNKPASEKDCDNHFMSELSFGGVHNDVSKDDHGIDTTKPKMTQNPHRSKMTAQKKIQPQHTVTKPSGFGGIIASTLSRIRKQGYTYRAGLWRFNIQPHVSRTTVGMQLNIGVDISFLENFIPSSLRSFWAKLIR